MKSVILERVEDAEPKSVVMVIDPPLEMEGEHRWVVTGPNGDEHESTATQCIFAPVDFGVWNIDLYLDGGEKPWRRGYLRFPEDAILDQLAQELLGALGQGADFDVPEVVN